MSVETAKYITSLKIITVEGRCPSKEASGSKLFERRIREIANSEFKVPYETPIVAEIDFFYHGEEKRPDIDNALKLILDSLKGIAFKDDKQVEVSINEIHDTSKITKFTNQPTFLVDMLMKNVLEYTVIRIYEK